MPAVEPPLRADRSAPAAAGPYSSETTIEEYVETQQSGWVVLKFGGTSVSRRNRWDTIGRLAGKRLKEDGRRVLVVVSALSGVTNELQAIAYAAPGQDDGIAAR